MAAGAMRHATRPPTPAVPHRAQHLARRLAPAALQAPPSPPQLHVLAPRAVRVRRPHRTEHCLSPSSSGHAPAYPTLPCGVTETSPLRGSEKHGTTKTGKTERAQDSVRRSQETVSLFFIMHCALCIEKGRPETERPLQNSMLLTFFCYG